MIDDPELLRCWDAISVFEGEEQARRKAIGRPWLGNAFIARLEIPEQASVRCERTFRTSGHYTLWGSPEDLMRWVVSVVPVRGEKE